jgi:prepilin-type N-terminal cleavage/methylation domain-containing protein
MMRVARGFTLVELIIVMAIIGLLATIVILRVASTRNKALIATMESDLRNLVTQQMSWKNDSGSYATSLPTSLWSPSVGVTGPTITLTGDGWTATVGHVSTTRTCAVFMGSTSVPPATKEGVPACSLPDIIVASP